MKLIRWGGLITLIEREIYRFTNVVTQTIIAPVISSFLFIFIFGFALGRSIETMAGVPYLVFIVPGLMALYLIESSYSNASSSLFLSRWSLYIQELLVTPLSYIDLVVAIIVGSLARGVVILIGVYVVASFFETIPLEHPFLLLYFVLMITIIFSSIGIIAALISEKFEHLAMFSNFVITPFVYLGGVFTSLSIVPAMMGKITKLNPFFYMVDGFRYTMLGSSDTEITINLAVITFFGIGLFTTVVWLFKIGYKIRA